MLDITFSTQFIFLSKRSGPYCVGSLVGTERKLIVWKKVERSWKIPDVFLQKDHGNNLQLLA